MTADKAPSVANPISSFSDECELLAKRAIEATGLQPDDDLFSFGCAISLLIDQAKFLTGPDECPTKSVALKAAEDAAKKAEKALDAIRKFNSLWAHYNPFNSVTSDAEKELIRVTQFFQNEFQREFDLFAHEAESQMFLYKPGIKENGGDLTPIKKVEHFVGLYLLREFERLFARKGTRSNSLLSEVSGHFPNFARFIMSEAGHDISVGTISVYMSTAKKTVA